jgi:predicted deacylase
MPVTGEAAFDEASKGLVMAFGLDHIVIDEASLRSRKDSLYTDQTALVRGIPAITAETGQMGLNDDYWVDMAEGGILNVLRHLEMIPGDERVNEGITWLTDYEVNRLRGNKEPAHRYFSGRSQGRLSHRQGRQTGRSPGLLR